MANIYRKLIELNFSPLGVKVCFTTRFNLLTDGWRTKHKHEALHTAINIWNEKNNQSKMHVLQWAKVTTKESFTSILTNLAPPRCDSDQSTKSVDGCV